MGVCVNTYLDERVQVAGNNWVVLVSIGRSSERMLVGVMLVSTIATGQLDERSDEGNFVQNGQKKTNEKLEKLFSPIVGRCIHYRLSNSHSTIRMTVDLWSTPTLSLCPRLEPIALVSDEKFPIGRRHKGQRKRVPKDSTLESTFQKI